MGACDFRITAEGISAADVFDELCHEAIREYGEDSYNGTISTTRLRNVIKISNIYTSAVDSKADKYIEKNGFPNKWETICLDLGVCKYRINRLKKIVPEIRKKAEYKTRFLVSYYDDMGNVRDKGSYETKTEAEKIANDLALKNGYEYFVSKRPVNINRGDDVVSKFSVITEIKKTAPKKVSANMTVKPIHKYVFYGVAAE